jgi:2'-5' RNA ligase
VHIGVAIDIPEPWGDELTRRRAQAGDPAAAHVPAHLTLLGPTEIDSRRLPEIERHLAAVATAHEPFALHLRGTGTFRPLTRVVFIAVAAGISECEQLAAAMQDSSVLSREQRFPYHPHVTVAHDVTDEAMDEVYEELAGFDARFTVDGFTLFEHEAVGDGREPADWRSQLWRPRRDFGLGSPAGRRRPERQRSRHEDH